MRKSNWKQELKFVTINSLYNNLLPKPVLEKFGIRIEMIGGFVIKPVGIVSVYCQAYNGEQA